MRFSVKLFKYFRINILLVPIIVSSIIFDYASPFLTSYICAVIHELAHIVTAKALNIGISCIEFQPFGVCARLKSDIISNPVSEIFVALSGPLCSLCLAFWGLWFDANEYFVMCNGAMAVINLLPILPLDGGRVLRAGLCLKMGAVAAYNIAVTVSRIPLGLILALGVYCLITSGFNLSLILIGVFLTGNLFAEQHNISRQAVREFLHYREKVNADDLSRATVLYADKNTSVGKILRFLSYSRYHIIHVTDENMNVTRTLTEGQLVEAVCKNGVRTTLGDIN